MNAYLVEARALLKLAFPVVVIQLGLTAMGAVDGAFLGRVDAVQYAAISIGHTWTFLFLVFGMGILTALDPLVSQAFGANDREAIVKHVQRGIVLALCVSFPVGIAMAFAEPVLEAFGQKPTVVPVAAEYARVSILSVAPFLVFVALRQALQAMHHLRPLVIVILAANLLNAFLDWVLIYGHLGFEPLGAVGSAWGTVLARWCMLFALVPVAGREFSRHLWPIEPRVFRLQPFLRTLRIGLPIGVSFLIEVGAFSTVAFLMGNLGENQLAGHQAAIALASASFMVPLAISMAASVRVGNEVGRGDAEAARRAARVALVGGAGVMVFFGALFLGLPGPLARIFTNLEPVLEVAVLLVPLAGLFQVFDGIQVVAVGVMRGLADTRIPMWIHVAGFWGVALPIGVVQAFRLERGPEGLWWGLVYGLFAVAVAQFLRLRVVLRRGLRRVHVDEPSAPENGS